MMNLKYLILFVAIIGILSSCTKDDEKKAACGADDPLETVDWLKDIKFTFDVTMGPQREQIIQYQYDGMDVFLINNCLNCPDALITVYDCEQNVVCEFGGIAGLNTCPDFDQNATDELVLYDN